MSSEGCSGLLLYPGHSAFFQRIPQQQDKHQVKNGNFAQTRHFLMATGLVLHPKCKIVLVLAGVELTVLIVAGVGLCIELC